MATDKPGTYVVAFSLSVATSIGVGRLGWIEFPAGWYLYVGSARGPGGLRARLARHRRRLGNGKRVHWHVDYLREKSIWFAAWTRESCQRLECDWVSRLLHMPGARTVAEGFGASDCPCSTHLVKVPALPDDDWFADNLGAKREAMADRTLTELLHTLITGDEDARETASSALGQHGAAAIQPLSEMLSDDDANARWWGARALAEVGRPGAVEPLIGVLTDPDPDVRACAALALGRIGNPQAAADLAARLDDDSAFVASIAADALTMIGEPAIEALSGMLAGEKAHTRLLAVRAMARIGSQRAIEPLFGAQEDDSYLVRYYAQEALEALGVGMIYLAQA